MEVIVFLKVRSTYIHILGQLESFRNYEPGHLCPFLENLRSYFLSENFSWLFFGTRNDIFVNRKTLGLKFFIPGKFEEKIPFRKLLIIYRNDPLGAPQSYLRLTDPLSDFRCVSVVLIADESFCIVLLSCIRDSSLLIKMWCDRSWSWGEMLKYILNGGFLTAR